MTLDNMRSLGVRSVDAICEETLCGHAATLNVDGLPDEFPVADVALRLRCSRCGSKAVSSRPNWLEARASGLARWPEKHSGANLSPGLSSSTS